MSILFLFHVIIKIEMPTKLKQKLPPIDLGNETIGQRITKFRKLKGWTQKNLAKKIGILHTLVSDYERGKLRLNDEMIIRFSIALEVTSDELLGLKELSVSITPNLRLIKRINEIEKLTLLQQKTILSSIDMMIDSAKRKSS
jgi:transcriptional regulator with XRE-family HTH domain